MKQTPKPIGRPTFRIDSVRLRALRKEAGLSQLNLAEMVYAQAGKKYASPEVLKNTVQRWEASGAIPVAMAKHLAEVLQTTVAILQGALPEPAPSRVNEIEARLLELLAENPTPRLIEALAHCEESGNPIRSLAMHVLSRLEVAQLSQAEEEFRDLAAITGYNIRELQEPTSFEGFWMLTRVGPLGPVRTEILTGVNELLRVVRTEMQSCLESWHESDAHVAFVEERHWFKVTINHPRHSQLTQTLRFVRCQPKEGGVQWSSPAWQDRYWVESMASDAYEYANVVTGFDSVRVPADYRSLRFAITKVPSLQEFEARGPDAPAEIIELIDGALAELPDDRMESFGREGNSHYLVVNLLTSDLWEKLVPLMSEWPMECWSLRVAQSRLDVLLDVPYRLYASSKAPLRFGHRFSVMLVEVLPGGGQRRAPWRQKSIVPVHERLMKSLWEAREAHLHSPPQLPAA
jgi:transcriptional regulator with XRE-family HTH domain